MCLAVGAGLCAAAQWTGFGGARAGMAARQRGPERTVSGNTIRSERDPRITLEFRPPVEYVGADRWVLYGVADCEIHVFVEAGARKQVSRLFWVQFEAYLPAVRASYVYDSPTRLDIRGREFIVDGGVLRTDAPYRRPDSDRERVTNLLIAKGYTLPAEMMTLRMVHLPDEQKRKELMIIYAEDLAPTGLTAADLSTGGKAEAEWPKLEKTLLRRASERITAR